MKYYVLLIFIIGNAYAQSRPSVESIHRGMNPGSNPTSSSSIEFDVNFSEAVTGVSVSDFELNISGNGLSAVISNVSSNDQQKYTVIVNNILGEGELRLDLNDRDRSIRSINGRRLRQRTFRSGETYTIEQASTPSVRSIQRGSFPADNPTGATSVEFELTFNQAVGPLNLGDVGVTSIGEGKASVSSISGGPVVWQIVVSTIGFNGDVGLYFNDGNNTVKNRVGVSVSPSFFDYEQTWTIDSPFPSVAFINRGSTPEYNPTTESQVEFDITFNKIIDSAVTVDDFCIDFNGSGSPEIIAVIGGPMIYTVRFNTNGAIGELGLDLCDSDSSIQDSSGNPVSPNTHISNQTWEIR